MPSCGFHAACFPSTAFLIALSSPPFSPVQQAVSGMQAELDSKDRLIRDLQAKIERLTEQLGESQELVSDLEERVEQIRCMHAS